MSDLHPHAAAAIRAAKLRNTKGIGRWAAMRYCQLRNVPLRLLTLALVLENAQQAGV